MFGHARRTAIIAALIPLAAASLGRAQTVDRIISDHVRVRVPIERQWLGTDSILDLERCWRFMNAATDGSLPRRVLVIIDWDGQANVAAYQDSSISIGMSRPAAAADPKAFLLHNCLLEMARMGLYGLSRGATDREENQFVTEGMAEILVHEYERNSRSLGAAWIICRMLDRMNLLAFKAQTSWTAFSGGRHDLRAASPGITFLLTCRDLHGRDRLLKFFEALRKGNLQESLAAAFKTNPLVLEEEWLKRVRSYQPGGDLTFTTDDDVPQLLKTVLVPEAGRPGTQLQLRLFVKDGSNNLYPWGVFLQDESTGKVVQAQPAPDRAASYMEAVIPLETDRQPGRYTYQITAVDESGNVRSWKGNYTVTP